MFNIMGGVESAPKAANEALIRECAVLNLKAYSRLDNPVDVVPDPPGYEYVITEHHAGNRADLYSCGVGESRSFVIVFPGSQSVGHWVHNTTEVLGVGHGIAGVIHAGQVRQIMTQFEPHLQDHFGDLIVTGHSRGGVQACLAVQYFKSMKSSQDRKVPKFPNISLVTFAAPLFSIDYGVVSFITLVEIKDDPIPGMSVAGVVIRGLVGWIAAYPGYSRWQVKYATPNDHTEKGFECHLMEFYHKVISNHRPAVCFNEFEFV